MCAEGDKSSKIPPQILCTICKGMESTGFLGKHENRKVGATKFAGQYQLPRNTTQPIATIAARMGAGE
jgi:hypothetical protein